MPEHLGRRSRLRAVRRSGGSSARKTPRPLQFSVALDQDAYLQLDDVVVTVRPVPGREPVATAGVVTEVRARHEGATYGSDVFLIAEGVLPAQVQEIAEVTTTRVDPEVYVPPWPARSSTVPPARSAPRRCTSTRWSARSRRPRPRRRPDLPEPGVPRRHPRRPRLHQRDLGGRHQDEFRALPAATRSSPAAR